MCQDECQQFKGSEMQPAVESKAEHFISVCGSIEEVMCLIGS